MPVSAKLFLGMDVGTSGVKAVLIDESRAVLAESTQSYPLSTPRPLWSEQDPDDWWNASRRAIRSVLEAARVDGARISAVGLSGQMHGLVLLDDAGAVLRPAILWNDQRTQAECDAITARVGAARMLELTGNPVLPGFTAPKIEWVRTHEPEVFRRVAHVLLPKDYVRYRLTHEFHSDVTDASGTSLFDVGKRAWSDEMIAALDIPRKWLPAIGESGDISASISSAAAGETGLARGTPVVAGAGDQAAQAVGCGVVAPGSVSISLGTSGVVFATVDRYRAEPQGRLHAFCHALPNTWHLMGVMLSAGGSLRWYRDTLCSAEKLAASIAEEDAYDILCDGAAKIPPGSEGLIFLPYLTGERTPYADPHARGAFIGLTLRHSKPHMTRAVLEGVAFGLRDALELILSLGFPVNQVRVTGGGARSRVWLQILADVLGVELVTLNAEQGAAFGAALLAAVGAGAFASVSDACRSAAPSGDAIRPGANHEVYRSLHPCYQALYPALAQHFQGSAHVHDKT